MTIKGVDYSVGRPNLDALWNDGNRFTMRYLSWLPNPKVILPPEMTALRKKGFAVGLNWEYAARDMLHGAQYGTIQATEAVRQARSLGYPRGCTIYYSADFDATPEQQAAINSYLNAAYFVHAQYYRVGIYGGYYVVKRALDHAPYLDGWQTYAWSAGQWDPRVDIRQTHNGVMEGGADVDQDTASSLSLGHLWLPDSPPAPAPAPAITHHPGSRMLFYRPPTMMTGEDVLFVQRFIGATHCGIADGKFGPGTKDGVVWYQRMRGIMADGIVGRQTWSNMGLHPSF